MKVEWSVLKSFVDSKLLSIQWIELPTYYVLKAIDSAFILECDLDKFPTDTTDLAVFEATYKAAGNARLSEIRDSDGASVARPKAAKTGWTYAAIPVEFQTARLSDSIYSKLADGTDRAGTTLKAYNGTIEVTTAGLLNANYATIDKTVVDIELPYDFEIIGGSLRTTSDLTSDIRLWIIAVPDIPAGSGGSKEMSGGVNLNFLAPNNEYKVDGRVAKYMTYNATYHTNKLRFIFKYDAGVNKAISLVLELYRQ